ncbi:hypothetical protein A2V82_03350 [candidate division KSB1 bacterium RBG_16_48_16]|nr:MAG: hypothetical protein A2V82_03350 [candidate division KSB1 bacterium RBG_16_48_16]
MHLGNTLFTIAGLVLLSTITLSLNTSILQNHVVLLQSEQILEGIALAQKYIEEAEACRYDEDGSATIPGSFTYAASFGPDDNEVYPYFDDIDDFDDFSTTIVSGTIPYQVDIEVDYVNDYSPDQPTTSRTYFKRMQVSISSPFLSTLASHKLVLKRMFAFHYFYSE